MTTLSIVIVTHDSAGFIEPCLDAAAAACGGLPFEIIVVDSASQDNTLAVLGRRAEVRVLPLHENVGFAAANNRGIAMAAGDTIVLLNPDTVARPDAFAVLQRFLERHARCAAVGPRLETADGSLQPSAGALPTLIGTFAHAATLNELLPRDEFRRERLYGLARRMLPRSASRLASHEADARRCEVVWAAAVALRAGPLRQVGLLDESGFMYGEENDLCARLRRAGWEVWFEPAAEVLHYGGTLSPFKPALAASFYAARLRYFSRYGRRLERRLAPLAIGAGLALRPLVRSAVARSLRELTSTARFSAATARLVWRGGL